METIADIVVTMAENEQRVYDAGYEKGYEEGEASGGGDNYYDTFWDAFQENGARTNYQHGFRFGTWSAESFQPKYSMYTTNTESMFREVKMPIDLVEHLNKLGVVLDTSNATDVSYMFYGAKLKRVGVINISNATKTNFLFYISDIETIDKLVVSPNNTYDNVLSYLSHLKNITIEGTIGNNFDIRASKLLTKASIISIFTHLQGTPSNSPTLTLSKAAVDKAFETSPGANDGSTASNSEYLNLMQYTTGWTIKLV